MNPEFRRNLWLELTPRRAILMAVILALIFVAVALSGGKDYLPSSAAETLYYLIVVFWGSRNAALSVVGEIRDRTWDSQRLSSITPGAMTWGKLFGATIYNWFGGAICLALMFAYTLSHHGTAAAVIDLFYFLEIGVIAQAAAMLASLAAVNRGQKHSRFEIFLYQLAGLLAALAVFYVWQAADPEGMARLGAPLTDTIVWWGQPFPPRGFLLASLALFTAWVLVGCYREMRTELKMPNGSLVWLGFLVFIGLYIAGFDAWLSQDSQMADWNPVALRLALAATTFCVLTYIMVLLEPKDRVQFRWLGSQVRGGHLARAFSGMQAFMLSYFATAICTVALIFWLNTLRSEAASDQALVGSALGFLTRDVG
ncbi:MAG TPA: hypothetical protein VH000_11865, partial [Rhizomicrobium sp.]|nr:hypothetical protein [Rhizomicrobium sp.]